MKKLLVICAALMVVVGFAASASAADHGISKSRLAGMGFAGARTMSDSEGLAVRGKGFHASNVQIHMSQNSNVGFGNYGNTSVITSGSHFTTATAAQFSFNNFILSGSVGFAVAIAR